MKKDLNTPLTEEYLKSIDSIQPADTKAFFYTRLRSRMDAAARREESAFLFKPALIAAGLAILLLLNLAVLFEYPAKGQTGAAATIRDFAAAYDQNINSSY